MGDGEGYRPADGAQRGGLPRARKRLGQNFLVDRRIRERIVDMVAPEDAACVVEVGPGRGALTDLLAERARRLVAIELDRDLAAHLRVRYEGLPHVTIVEGDVLEVEPAVLAGGPYRLVGNVPYYITTPILFHAMRYPRPDRAVFLVQREVAERIVAAPGGGDYGALTVNLAAIATSRIELRVPARAFSPRPKVDSAVVVVEPRATPLVMPEEEQRFREFVIAIFGLRRKQMRRVIRTIRSLDAGAADAALERAGIIPQARPEELPPDRFVQLLRTLGG